MTIAEKLLRAKTDIDEVYNAGIEVGKEQGVKPILFGTYILKEPITSEDLIVGYLEEAFPADSVYAYFYDSKINDYVYLPVEWLYRADDFYDWNTTDGDTSHSKALRDGKWVYSWFNAADESGDGLYPDIKGRIIVFTKPTVVSEKFYNLFMATTNGAEENYDEGYVAGNILYYATYLSSIFEAAVFPEKYEMVLKLQKIPLSHYRAFALAKNLKSVKIIIDDKEEKSVEFNQTFRENADIETVDLTECPRKFSAMQYAFMQAHNLKNILGELDLSECTNDTSLTYAFFAASLEEVRVVANTIKVPIRFTSIYLTDASIDSIVNGLRLITDGTTRKLDIPSPIISRLTEEQITMINMKKWTI